MAPTDANRRTITALQREERGDRPSGHRTPRFHHQAPVLLGTEEEIPGQVRPDVESEPYDGGFGIMREAPVVQDRGRVVRIQPGCEPSADVTVRRRPAAELADCPGPGTLPSEEDPNQIRRRPSAL